MFKTGPVNSACFFFASGVSLLSLSPRGILAKLAANGIFFFFRSSFVAAVALGRLFLSIGEIGDEVVDVGSVFNLEIKVPLGGRADGLPLGSCARYGKLTTFSRNGFE